MSQSSYDRSRSFVFILVQAILALAIVGVYLLIIAEGRGAPDGFEILVGVVATYFFEQVREARTSARVSQARVDQAQAQSHLR